MFITKQAAEVFEVWNQQQEKSLKRNRKKRKAYKELTKSKPKPMHWGKVNERDVEHEIWSKAKGWAATATTERKTYGVYNPLRKRKGKKVERITGTRIYFLVILFAKWLYFVVYKFVYLYIFFINFHSLQKGNSMYPRIWRYQRTAKGLCSTRRFLVYRSCCCGYIVQCCQKHCSALLHLIAIVTPWWLTAPTTL